MSFRRPSSLVLVLVLAPLVSACGSSGGTTAGGSAEAAAPTGGSATLIVREQLDQFPGRDARAVVEIVNRRWLRATRGGGAGGQARYARVVIEGTPGLSNTRGDFSDLIRLRADQVESMRFVNAQTAATRYGLGFEGGVIEVTLRRR